MSDCKPNFYAIIPAHVRYCKELEPNAKLLYGEITALCHQEGYCWANNKYFSDLYDVEPRTIRNWLASLKENNFIKVEDQSDTNEKRKIWICCDFQNKFREEKNDRGGGKKVPGGEEKNDLHNNTVNITSEKTVCPKPPVGASVSDKLIKKVTTDGKEIRLEKDDLFRHAIQKNKRWLNEEIEDAWHILCEYAGRVNDLFMFIEGTIENLRKKKGIEKLQNTQIKETKCHQHQGQPGRIPTKEEIDILMRPSPERDCLMKTLKEFRIG